LSSQDICCRVVELFGLLCFDLSFGPFVLSLCLFFPHGTVYLTIKNTITTILAMARFLFFNEKMSRMTPCRRVDSLEQLVHSTLAELVTIANEAGVPTGGKAWM